MKVKANDNFSDVFGADDMLKHWPEITSTGVEVREIRGLYYIIENGKVVHDSAFFSQDELDNCLTILD